MHPRLVILIVLLAATAGFVVGRLSPPVHADAGGQPAATGRSTRDRAPGGSADGSLPTRTHRPNRSQSATPPASARFSSGSRLEDDIVDFFGNGNWDEWIDTLAWAAIEGSLVMADRDDALRAIRAVGDALERDSDPAAEIAGFVITHTAWMRIGELENEAAIDEFARWAASPGNDKLAENEDIFPAVIAGWARNDPRAAREWVLDHIAAGGAGLDPVIAGAIEDSGPGGLREAVGLDRPETPPQRPVYVPPSQ